RWSGVSSSRRRCGRRVPCRSGSCPSTTCFPTPTTDRPRCRRLRPLRRSRSSLLVSAWRLPHDHHPVHRCPRPVRRRPECRGGGGVPGGVRGCCVGGSGDVVGGVPGGVDRVGVAGGGGPSGEAAGGPVPGCGSAGGAGDLAACVGGGVACGPAVVERAL